jgi:hypothetical protein
MADRKKVVPLENPDRSLPGCIEGVRLGKVTEIDATGQVLIDYPGNIQGHLTARLTSTAKEKLRQGSPIGREVLLVFENNDPGRPVIIDTLYSLLDEIAEQSKSVLQVQKPEDVTVDRKRLIFDAEEEIVLRCGEASITLTSAGKVLIKGNYLVSRSSGANRIKGCSVQIN